MVEVYIQIENFMLSINNRYLGVLLKFLYEIASLSTLWTYARFANSLLCYLNANFES